MSEEREGVKHFNWLCSLLPEDFNWSDPLTPDVADHIAQAARQSAGATGQGPVGEWVKAAFGDFPALKWREGYVAEIGAKLYAAPIGDNGAKPAMTAPSVDVDPSAPPLTLSPIAQPAASGTDAVFAAARKAVEKDMAGFCERLADMAQPAENKHADLAHEIWAAAQLAPGESISDGVERIEALLADSKRVELTKAQREALERAVCDTAARGHIWASRSISELLARAQTKEET